MREKLEKLTGRIVVVGTFIKYGTKTTFNGNHIRTVLLRNLTTTDGELLTDHQWLLENLGFQKLNLRYGEKVSFSAVVQRYFKGRNIPDERGVYDDFKSGRECDYQFIGLRDLKKV